ncbi:MAG: ABC transporter ATP-binding protein [Desulfurococcales archaeon]|nr:ABC transporter ATP-binding protein [Desulfurococcales archaeon]
MSQAQQPSLIEAHNIKKTYPNVGIVLNNISLELYQGEAILITGPNGSGKTTLLRILAGVEKPDDGTVMVLGEKFTSPEQKILIGVVLDRPGLYPELTVRENLDLYSRLRGASLDDKVLDLLGLREVLDRRVDELSFGWRRRVDIARSLIGDPRILLIDEPFTGLDEEASEKVSRIMDHVRSTGGIIATSPDPALAKAYDWSRVVVLKDGVLNMGTV